MLKLMFVLFIAALAWVAVGALDWILGIGIFGVVFGLIGAIFGVILGVMGAVFGVVAGVLGVVFGVLAVLAALMIPVLMIVGLVKLFRAAF